MVSEHQPINEEQCPNEHKNLIGIFPENVNDYIKYRDSVTLTVVLLWASKPSTLPYFGREYAISD